MAGQQDYTILVGIITLVGLAVWLMIFLYAIDPILRKLIGRLLGVTVSRQTVGRRLSWHVEEAGRPAQALIVQVLYYLTLLLAAIVPLAIAGLVLWQMGILNPNDIDAFLNS